MLRSLSQFTPSIRNLLNANKLLKCELVKRNLNVIEPTTRIQSNFKKKTALEHKSKYFAIYFYQLVNDFFKTGIGYDKLKEGPIFNETYKATLNYLNDKNQFNIPDKLSILRSLQTIGVPSDNELIRKLIEDLNLNLNKLNLDKALKVLLNQVQFQDSDLQKEFVNNLVKFIESKQAEISNLNTVLMIYNEKIANLFSKEFMNKVDFDAIQLSTSSSQQHPLKDDELTWILHKLSLTKRRSKPFIQFLTNNLINNDFENLDLNKAISLVNSLSDLSYLNIALMSKLENYLVQNQFFINANKFDFNQLMKSFINLRYEPTILFNHLVENAEIVNDRLGTKSLMNLISTMAFFNYSRKNATKLLNKSMFKQIDIDLVKDHVLLIDYLWALAFYDHLNKAPLDLFTLDFYSKILDKEYFYYLRPRFVLLYQYCRLNLGLDVKLPDKYLQSTQPFKGSNKLKIDDFLVLLKKSNYLTNVESEFATKFGRF